jgi:hypothetical protein
VARREEEGEDGEEGEKLPTEREGRFEREVLGEPPMAAKEEGNSEEWYLR